MNFHPRPLSRSIAATVLAVALAAGACSSGDDATTADGDASSGAGVEETAGVDSEGADTDADISDGSDGEGGAYALTCDEVQVPAMQYNSAAVGLGQVVDDETAELFGIDYAAASASVEQLRPIQDIDGLFGPMRDYLDNMAADLAAAEEGRYDDMTREYGRITLNAVIGEELCA